MKRIQDLLPYLNEDTILQLIVHKKNSSIRAYLPEQRVGDLPPNCNAKALWYEIVENSIYPNYKTKTLVVEVYDYD